MADRRQLARQRKRPWLNHTVILTLRTRRRGWNSTAHPNPIFSTKRFLRAPTCATTINNIAYSGIVVYTHTCRSVVSISHCCTADVERRPSSTAAIGTTNGKRGKIRRRFRSLYATNSRPSNIVYYFLESISNFHGIWSDYQRRKYSEDLRLAFEKSEAIERKSHNAGTQNMDKGSVNVDLFFSVLNAAFGTFQSSTKAVESKVLQSMTRASSSAKPLRRNLTLALTEGRKIQRARMRRNIQNGFITRKRGVYLDQG